MRLALALSALALLLLGLSVAFISADRWLAERARKQGYQGRRRLVAGVQHRPLSCGCRDDGASIYECPTCDKTGCEKHRIPPHECLPDRLSQEASADA